MHTTFLERLERSPLPRAREYRRRMQRMGAKSVREFCRDEGEDWSVVSRHLRLLRLAGEIITFLDNNQAPGIFRHFTVKRLDPLTRLPETEATLSFMQDVKDIGLRGVTIVV